MTTANRLSFFMASMALTIAFMASPAHALRDESGPGNATEYVKVLFAEAQFEVLRELAPVALKDTHNLDLEDGVKQWLATGEGANSRFELLKSYLRKMELRFQQEPCSDGSGKPGSICFFRDEKGEPYVMISLQENKMTTKDQAAVMLLHEAGHFTGEMDHRFLDRVGVQVVNALRVPRLLIADAKSSEYSPSPWIAKDQCEAGNGSQAQVLRNQALADLKIQCASRRITCDPSKTEFIYAGQVNFEPGLGFDMKVTCQVKALLATQR
jgi:hypothetical protein